MLKIAKMFNYTAMGVGNHDFDDGPDGLLPFVQECDFPVLGANLQLENFPELNDYFQVSNCGIGTFILFGGQKSASYM